MEDDIPPFIRTAITRLVGSLPEQHRAHVTQRLEDTWRNKHMTTVMTTDGTHKYECQWVNHTIGGQVHWLGSARIIAHESRVVTVEPEEVVA